MNLNRKQKPEADLNAQTDLEGGLVLNVWALKAVSQLGSNTCICKR